MIDFYIWEYRYGHDLSDDAPMKLEESYQPPLFGTKQLLNITVTSLPERGGYAFSIAAILAALVLLLSFRSVRGAPLATVLLLSAIIPIGCSSPSDPEPTEIGKDQCHTCKMLIVDGRYGGQAISDKGKIYKFDSIDCLRSFAAENAGANIAIYLVDYENPGSFVPARQAHLIKFESRSSPMGSRLIAFSNRDSAQRMLSEPDAKVYSWLETAQLELQH